MKAFFLITIINMLLFPWLSNAQTITKEGKNKEGKSQVIISFDHFSAEEVKLGAEFYSVTPEGKKTGIIRLVMAKGNLAKGDVLKGKAAVGQKVVARAAAPEVKKSKSGHVNPGFPFGVLVGMANSSMALTAQYDADNIAPVERSADVTLNGTSTNFKILGEIPVMEGLFIRGFTGLETFVVKGTGESPAGPICDNGTSSNCTVNFNYLAFEGSGHWTFLKGKVRGHLGAGYSYLVTMSKSVNIPNLKSATATNQMILAKLGLDFMAKKFFFPVTVEYGYIPGDNVKAGAVYVRTGMGFYF